MNVPRAFILVWLVLILVNNAVCIIPDLGQAALSIHSTIRDITDTVVGGRDASGRNRGLLGAYNKVNETFESGSNTLKGAINSGYNVVNSTFETLDDTANGLLNAGLRVGEGLRQRAQIPLRLLSGMAYAKIDNFESYAESKEKYDEINKKMSEFLKNDSVVLPEYLEKDDLLDTKYIEVYKSRCKEGDCFTYENNSVVKIHNKVDIKLPVLAQVDYSYQLFKQSGAYTPDGILNSMTVIENYNSFDHFILLLSKHNLNTYEFINTNDEAVNTFYYRATLFYKKFALESNLRAKYDVTKTFGHILGFYVKADLMRLAEVSTYNKDMTVDDDEIATISDGFAKYLAEDAAAFVVVSDAYAKLCKECLTNVHEDNRPAHEMMKYLESAEITVDKFCRDDSQECHDMLQKYLVRCAKGDCYTFDNVCITEKLKFKVMVPVFAQVRLALTLFKNSKAHRGSGIVGFFKRLFRIQTEKTLRYFIKLLARHNIRILFFNNQSEKILNDFLYRTTLFFARFITISKLIKFYSMNKFTLWMFSIDRTKYLKDLAKDLTFGAKVALAGQSLSKIIDNYSHYLVNSNLREHGKVAKYFTSICKKIILRHVTDDRIATEMYDSSFDLNAEEICGNAEKRICATLVQEFLLRCKNGDCYTLDTKDYYTENKMYKITLPILYQVDAAIYVFKKSKSNGYFAKRFYNTYGPEKKVDPYVQFYRNITSHNNKLISTKTFDNEVLTKYLYNSTVYFKFLSENKLFGFVDVSSVKDVEDNEPKMESFFMKMIKSLAGLERVRFKQLNLEDVYDIVQKHMRNTGEVKDTASSVSFINTGKKVLKKFKEIQNNDQMFERYSKDSEYY